MVSELGYLVATLAGYLVYSLRTAFFSQLLFTLWGYQSFLPRVLCTQLIGTQSTQSTQLLS